MKQKFILFIVAILFAQLTFSQIPSITLKNMDGKTINTSSINKMGKPVIVSFFATWCKPCLRELKAINEVYEDWQDETNVELIAVSIDDSQNTAKVKSLVNGLGWEYSIWLDSNSDFKRAMGVNLIPAIFVLDRNGKIIESKSGYTDGGENDIIEKIRESEKSFK